MDKEEAVEKLLMDFLRTGREEGVPAPSDPMDAMVEAGNILLKTREHGEYNMQAALKAMKEKYGMGKGDVHHHHHHKHTTSEGHHHQHGSVETSGGYYHKHSSMGSSGGQQDEQTRGNEDDDESVRNESSPKKKHVPPAHNPENQDLADQFKKLASFEVEHGDGNRGVTSARVAQAIRDTDKPIHSGQDAKQLRNVGDVYAAKVDEYMETGKIEKLQEYEAQEP